MQLDFSDGTENIEYRFMGFYAHPILLRLKPALCSYRLIQIYRDKLVMVQKASVLKPTRGIAIPWKNCCLVKSRNGRIRLVTEGNGDQRQIWLVDMKVKL